jgi:hypothetical protein
MAEILFENITGTSLYRPLSPAPGEALRFLSTTPPDKKGAPLSLDATWDGTPIGYYLFLKKLPDDDAKFEPEAVKALDLATDPPDHTGFAWLDWDGTTVTVIAQVVMKAASPGDPLVKTDTLISVSGFPGVGVAADAPVLGNKGNEGFLDGFVLAYPPQPAHDGQPASGPPWGGGMTIPMAGDYAGCVRFQALLNAGQSSGNAVRKQVANVSLDPTRPRDNHRTRISLTGVLLDFGQLPSGAFYLEPVHAGTAAH